MFDCEAVASELADDTADPRLDAEYVRCRPGTDGSGSVLLIGVVHDHPASVFRVSHLLRTFDPSVVALELPPLSVSLFQRYARDTHTPPRLGGEMSAAIQAAGAVEVVGIDAPNRWYLRTLVHRLRTESSRSLTRSVLRDTVAGIGQALACRLGAAVARLTPHTPRVYTHIPYETTLLEDPDAQADHERTHLARHRAFVGLVDPPPATALVDRTREDVMAARIDDLRAEGDVIALVGMSHLDGLDRRVATLAETA